MIAELFLEKSLFDLSQLLRYRNGEFDPRVELAKIEDTALREMIVDMIKLDPSERKSAEDFLKHSVGAVFPTLFRDLLHDYVANLSRPPRDVLAAYQWQSPSFKKLLASEADYRIEKLHREFSTIMDVASGDKRGSSTGSKPTPERFSAWSMVEKLGDLSIPNCTLQNMIQVFGSGIETVSTLLTTVVCSSAHNCVFTSSKLAAMDLLLAMSLNSSDESKLDRILPFVTHFLHDEVPAVRATAVRIMTQLVSSPGKKPFCPCV